MVSVQLSWPETRQLLLALRLGPLGAPDSGVWTFPLLPGRDKDGKPTEGPGWVTGLA